MAKTTQVQWTDDEAFALDKGCARLGTLVGRGITRPELLKVLVRAWGSGLTVEQLVTTATRDTQPPAEGLEGRWCLDNCRQTPVNLGT